MASNFPTSLDTFTNPTSADALDSVSVPHATQHSDLNDAVEALQAKVGINSSAVTSSHDYKIAQLEAGVTGGKILQVVNAVYTTPTTIATTALTDTGLTASIDMTEATNKCLIIVTQSFQTARASDRQRFRFQIERDATAIVTDSGQWVNMTAGGASSINHGGTVSAAVLDSPATTSTVTYSVQLNCELTSLSGQVVAQYNDAPSTITLLEVSA